MSLDIDGLLNLERRTGIKNDEIDDFVRKTTQVEAALRGILDGTLNPDDVKIEGLESEEEKKKKELELEERRRQIRERDEKLRLQRKQEEISRWWSGVEFFKPKKDDNDNDDNEESAKPSVLSRYTADYSKWESWVPTDEATKEEQANKLKEEEDIKNKEFEKSNPDFCKQFVTDMEQRKKTMKEKEESSNNLRLKGNRYFKNKDFQKALELYMDALKESPYDSKLLLNIAQVHIKVKCYEDALEFIKRTLYVEDNSVKALSRKAFVLSEQGNYTDALEAINSALKFDPKNIELITQQKEIAVMKEEKQSEKRLQELKEVTEKLKSANIETEKAVEETSEMKRLHKIDSIKDTADEINGVLKANAVDIQKEELPRILTVLCNSLKDVAKYIPNNSLLVAHIRQSDALLSVISSVKALWEYWQKNLKAVVVATRGNHPEENTTTASLETQIFQSLCLMYDFINASMEGQRSSKQLIVDHKLYTVSKQILESIQESTLTLSSHVIHHIYLLCKDNVCSKSRLLIFSDPMTLHYVSHIMGNVIYNMQRKGYSFLSTKAAAASVVSEEDKNTSLVRVFQLIQDCFAILKMMIFSENPTDKALIATLTASTSLPLFYSLGHAGQYFFQQSSHVSTGTTTSSTQNKQIQEIIEENVQSFVEVFVGLSQYELIRENFAVDIAVKEEEEADKGRSSSATKTIPKVVTIVSIVLDIITKYPDHAANGLGILMNASLEAEGIVKQAIADNPHGRAIALSCLEIVKKIAAQQQENNHHMMVSAEDGLIAARKAGLLSRIATVPIILTELSQPSHYQLLCKFLKVPITYGGIGNGKNQEIPKWVQDQHGHFIRVLASLPHPSAANRAIAQKEGILSSLLALFPMPRMECGEITPLSVTLMPAQPAPAQLLGNAARCLMPYADDLTYATILYQDASLYGVEKLICAMATCVDIRVRRNIAILLAKGCRVPGIREKITTFRGLQMMIELQDKL